MNKIIKNVILNVSKVPSIDSSNLVEDIAILIDLAVRCNQYKAGRFSESKNAFDCRNDHHLKAKVKDIVALDSFRDDCVYIARSLAERVKPLDRIEVMQKICNRLEINFKVEYYSSYELKLQPGTDWYLMDDVMSSIVKALCGRYSADKEQYKVCFNISKCDMAQVCQYYDHVTNLKLIMKIRHIQNYDYIEVYIKNPHMQILGSAYTEVYSQQSKCICLTAVQAVINKLMICNYISLGDHFYHDDRTSNITLSLQRHDDELIKIIKRTLNDIIERSI